jgi:hypothetical protein
LSKEANNERPSVVCQVCGRRRGERLEEDVKKKRIKR